MGFSLKTPLMQKVIFFAVLIIGAIVWKFGADYFVKSTPESEPYEVEQLQIKPL
jgi:hypothetical protein